MIMLTLKQNALTYIFWYIFQDLSEHINIVIYLHQISNVICLEEPKFHVKIAVKIPIFLETFTLNSFSFHIQRVQTFPKK